MADKKTDTRIPDVAPTPPPSERVESWKEIAAYLQRDVRTVQRWEKSEALPVYRHMHDKLGTVYAYKAELDAWWNNRRPRLEAKEAEEAEETQEGWRWRAVAAAAAVVLAVGVGVWLWLGREPVLPFTERDWVLITQFENRTGDPLFDGTLEYALQQELSNSRYVNVAPRERIEDALRLMKQPPDAPLNAALGREVCLRDGGMRVVLTGKVQKVDTTYLLGIALMDPRSGVTVAGLSEEANGEREVVGAMRRLARRVRESLGENRQLIQQSEQKLAQVTTPSLRALHLYTQAARLAEDYKLRGAAAELLRRAVEADPEFSSAHLLLAHCYTTLNKWDEANVHYRRAFELTDTTTDRERYHILGSYYTWSEDNLAKAAEAFETLLALYPDDYHAANSLSHIYRVQGHLQQSARYMERRAQLRPNDFMANAWAAMAMAIWERDRERARPYLARAEAVLPLEMERGCTDFTAWVELFPAFEYWLGGDPQKALSEVARLESAINTSRPECREPYAAHLGSFYLSLGKLDAAEEAFRRLSQPRKRHRHLAALAYVEGNLKAAGEHAAGGGPDVLLLARTGYLAQAQRALESMEKREAPDKTVRPLRGELALAQGRTQEAISLLEDSTHLLRPTGGEPLVLALESLALACEARGDRRRAVQSLEEASKERPRLFLPGLAGHHWLRTQLRLAQLYRQGGQEARAQEIEAELRKLLAVADADHPIVRQLKRSQDVAAAQPAN